MMNPRLKALISLIVVAGLLASLTPAPPPIGPRSAVAANPDQDITYIYDALGRLKAVVDPASDAAIYS